MPDSTNTSTSAVTPADVVPATLDVTVPATPVGVSDADRITKLEATIAILMQLRIEAEEQIQLAHYKAKYTAVLLEKLIAHLPKNAVAPEERRVIHIFGGYNHRKPKGAPGDHAAFDIPTSLRWQEANAAMENGIRAMEDRGD